MEQALDCQKYVMEIRKGILLAEREKRFTLFLTNPTDSMNKMNFLSWPHCLLCGLAVILSWGLVGAQPATESPLVEEKAAVGMPAAIFVRNLAGPAMNGKEEAFENLVSARVSGLGLLPISRSDVLHRLQPEKKTAAAQTFFPPAASLEEQSSALHLAQNLGADYVLSLAFTGYDKEEKEFQGSGIATANVSYSLGVAWRLLEAGQGGAITGGTVSVSRTFRSGGSLQERVTDVTNRMLADAAEKVAEAVRQRLTSDAERIAAARPKESDRVNFTVSVVAKNIFFPELSVDEQGTLRLANPQGAVGVDSVVVELDGVALGSAKDGQGFKARPGLHRLRLSREGFKPWEGMVNLFDGFNFNATLELSDAGLARWREQARFIQDLKDGAKLTDAQIKVIEGYAQTLRQSGFKIDYKVDAKEFPADNSVRVIH